MCVCAFGALIKEPLLSEYQMLNVHPSLLPRWRGAAPIERAIMAGDERTGVSIMRLTAGLDSGPVCLQATEPIAPETPTARSPRGCRSSAASCWSRRSTSGRRAPSRTRPASPTPRRSPPRTAVLDPGRPRRARAVVRALTPHIGAYAGADRRHPARRRGGARRAATGPGPPRRSSWSLDGPLPVLGCAEGALELLTVQPPGRRAMTGEDYLRGPAMS